MTSLIERLSKLDGPCRETDWEIQKFFMGEWLHKHGYKREGNYYRTDTPPISGAKICSGPEYYTSSIEAAIALAERVLPGWTIAHLGQDDHKLWNAELRQGHLTSYSHVTLGGSSTPAIALVIATLRAKEASSHDE